MKTCHRLDTLRTGVDAGLWEDGDYREVRGLGQAFRSKGELKAKGYAFAMQYGSDALAKAMAWLDFPELRKFLPIIRNGPTDLRDALDAAFSVLDGAGKTITDEQATLLQEHTGGWFGAAHEIRRMLMALRAAAPRGAA